MLLCFTPTDIDLPPASRPSAGQVDTQNQAWDILVGGAHGSNIDKRANAIQALGLAAGDRAAVRLAEKTRSGIKKPTYEPQQRKLWARSVPPNPFRSCKIW